MGVLHCFVDHSSSIFLCVISTERQGPGAFKDDPPHMVRNRSRTGEQAAVDHLDMKESWPSRSVILNMFDACSSTLTVNLDHKLEEMTVKFIAAARAILLEDG
jgi:hypothetical protein